MSVARGAAPGIGCSDDRAPQEICLRDTPSFGAQQGDIETGRCSVSVSVSVKNC
jgi:hypothetical protein